MNLKSKHEEETKSDNEEMTKKMKEEGRKEVSIGKSTMKEMKGTKKVNETRKRIVTGVQQQNEITGSDGCPQTAT